MADLEPTVHDPDLRIRTKLTGLVGRTQNTGGLARLATIHDAEIARYEQEERSGAHADAQLTGRSEPDENTRLQKPGARYFRCNQKLASIEKFTTTRRSRAAILRLDENGAGHVDDLRRSKRLRCGWDHDYLLKVLTQRI